MVLYPILNPFDLTHFLILIFQGKKMCLVLILQLILLHWPVPIKLSQPFFVIGFLQ